MILALSASWGLAVAAAAAVSYGALALGTSRLNGGTLKVLLFAAWLLHGLTVTEGLLGNPPRFGFAPALSISVWLVLTVYAIERRLLPQLRAHWALASFGCVAVLLSIIFPGTGYSLAGSAWLPLHWALGLASYGLFAAAVVHGWLMGRAERSIRLGAQTEAGVPLLTLERLTFRFVEAGFVLLSATLLAGWLFTEQLYGPGLLWQWNHKTVFSVLAWLAFAALLTGRARLGWRGLKAVRVLYVGAGLLLLSYVGSRFVLEVVLNRI